MTTSAAFLSMQDDDPFAELEAEERPVKQPRFRPVGIESPHDLAGAIYALRMIRGGARQGSCRLSHAAMV